MSIKLKELELICNPFLYKNQPITFNDISNAIAAVCKEYALSVAFRFDEISTGSILNSNFVPCLILYHPQHYSDYCSICFTREVSGNICKISLYSYGLSKQIAMETYNQSTKLFNSSDVTGAMTSLFSGGSYGIGRGIGELAVIAARGAIVGAHKLNNSYRMDGNAIASEKMWYENVFLALHAVFD